MIRSSLWLVLLLAAGLTACHRTRADRKWPPDVQEVAEASIPLAPNEAMKTFYMPPGYSLELVASEPMIVDPIWIDMDPDGRLWVIEMRGFMPTADERNTTRAPVCRVVVLEDDDDDGAMDRSTVFLDDLVLPRSLKVLDQGVLIAEPPNLWLARDTDGDLRADSKELVRDDFGRYEGNPEHNANGLLWGLDNWIYTSEHDGHFRFERGKLEHHPTVRRGQWSLTMDDVGRVYRNWNEQPAFVDLLPGRYYARNPNLVRTRGSYELLMDPEEMTIWPVRPTRGVNRGYREGTLRPDGTLRTYVSAGTPTVYRGDRLPTELQGNLFVTEPAGNLVHRLVLVEEEGNLRAKNAYERGEFLASTDERFRPVNLLAAADGTLYVVDMYRGIIQEGQYQTEYLRNYIKTRKLDVPLGLGRIYRVVHESTRRDRKPALSKATPSELVALLSHPNGWWRDTAQRLLVERGETSVVPPLKRHASSATDHRTRLHALWTVDGLGAMDETTVARALTDRSPYVRASAIRLAERWLGEPDHPLQAAVLERLDDTDNAVRRQLAASLGALPEPMREKSLITVLERFGDDPVAVDAAISGLQGREAAVLETLLESTDELDDAVAMLAGALMREGEPAAIERIFQWAGQTGRASWQSEALLRGVEAALPGGAPGSAPSGGGRGRGRTAPAMALAHKPDALVRLAAAGRGGLSELAARVAARLDWPGKPNPTANASGGSRSPKKAPLTAEEEERFAAGREVYENLCVACHQTDGRGLPNVAPTLVGSRWAVGEPGHAIRIVLNGKEGQEMMPPLESLSNEQIAAALTYVRRAWGQTASPVDPALVKQVRALSADRTRPWTEEELLRIR
ncbi:MAG: c-type cytochrome [Luteitalea sp.]|nr:c-type cytochrome [Luteitalea sp.]